MCIRDSRKSRTNTQNYYKKYQNIKFEKDTIFAIYIYLFITCLLYTSDAADERSSVDLGGRRIIKKKNNEEPLNDSVNETLN